MICCYQHMADWLLGRDRESSCGGRGSEALRRAPTRRNTECTPGWRRPLPVSEAHCLWVVSHILVVPHSLSAHRPQQFQHPRASLLRATAPGDARVMQVHERPSFTKVRQPRAREDESTRAPSRAHTTGTRAAQPSSERLPRCSGCSQAGRSRSNMPAGPKATPSTLARGRAILSTVSTLPNHHPGHHPQLSAWRSAAAAHLPAASVPSDLRVQAEECGGRGVVGQGLRPRSGRAR